MNIAFNCNQCGKNYMYKRNLHTHQKYECGKDPQFICPYCENKKSDEVRTSIFRCSSCSRSYKYRESLYNHKKYECGKEPQFKCPQCPYKTKRKGSLTSHTVSKHWNVIV